MNHIDTMKLALNALEGVADWVNVRTKEHPWDQFQRVAPAITALREALAEQPAQTDWEAVAADQAMTIALMKAEQPAQQCKWPICQSEEYQQVLAEQIKRELYTGEPAQPQEIPSFAEWTNDYVRDNLHKLKPPQQQEPVAWRWLYNGQPDSEKHFSMPGPDAEVISLASACEFPRTVQYLYTSPPAQRKPLTDEEQIAEALRRHGLTLVKTAKGYDVMSLGHITAHGIKGDA